ncbi:MAG: hypothetical protein PVF17_00945 [Ignavibacteria bacterium]|jgi:hypothetical protein
MNELKGTEKQIKWAKDIFNEKIEELLAWKKIVDLKTNEKANIEKSEIANDLEFAKSISSAEFLIKNRDMDFRGMRKYVKRINDSVSDDIFKIKF